MCLHVNTCTGKGMVVIIAVICLIIIAMQYSEISKPIIYALDVI